MNDFERESSTMDMKEEMMSDAVDDAMEDEDEGEGEEAEGDKILKEVLDEIGMGMNDSVRHSSGTTLKLARKCTDCKPNVGRSGTRFPSGCCRRVTFHVE
jgi:hypothetical protein